MALEMHHMIIPNRDGEAQEFEIVDQEARSVVEVGLAQLDAVADDVNDIKSALNKEPSDIPAIYEMISGEYVKSTDGAIYYNDTYSRTEFINLKTASSFTLAWIDSRRIATPNAMCFYDSLKAYISGVASPIGTAEDSRTFDVPADAVYIIISGRTDVATKISVTLNAVVTPIGKIWRELNEKIAVTADFNESFIDQSVPLQNIIGVTKFSGNLVNPTECVNNQYVRYTNGSFVDNVNYWRTGYIPVEEGKTYKSNVGRNNAWYDDAYNYISGNNGVTIQSGIIAPQNAKYLCVSINKSTDGIISPLALYITDMDHYKDGVEINELITNKVWCYGKKINWIGDSIVDGRDFDEEVCEALGLVKNSEYGINGSTIALNGDGTDGRDALCERYVNMSDDADIIAVSCGTNDFEYAWSPIGTIESTEKTTFYGALKTLCEGLINKYPTKVIFFTTPIKRAQPFVSGAGGEYTEDGVMTTPFSRNKYGKTLGDYADIIKEVCGYYSIPVLDMYCESLLNPHLASQQNMFDSVYTHPNTMGQKIMARRVAGWIGQLGYTIPNLT